MKKPEILVVGSSNTDMIIKLQRIPAPGETLLGGEFLTAAGGKGANQAVGAARAGGAVTFVARVGNDVLGHQALAGFARDNVNTNFIVQDNRWPSGVALIFVAADGQNSIAVAPGANSRLSRADLRHALPAFARAKVLLVQLETPLPTVLAAVQLAAKHGVPVMLNPAPAQPLPDALLRKLCLVTPNEHEAELLSGVKITSERSAAQAARKLRGRGARAVVITLGERGALVSDHAGERRIPGFKVKAVDTTGAGDIFNGALSVALAEGKLLDDAVRFACAAAALSVSRFGAQPSAPSRRNIDALYREFQS